MVSFDIGEATRRAIEALTPDGFEQLAYEILEVSYPGIRRMRAPDGGADLILDGPPTRVWQAKHYDQIDWSAFRKSLERAVAVHAPKSVTFVIPADLTANQQKSWTSFRRHAPHDVTVDLLSFGWFHAQLERPELRGARDRLLTAPAQSLVAQRVTVEHAPSIPQYCVARNDVFEVLDRWWDHGTETVLAVVGLGGAGKSTVVQQWFDSLTGAPSGDCEGALQFSFYEHGDRTFADFLRLAQRALGLPFNGTDAVDALLTALATRRLLIFLDGVERLLREYAVAAPELVEEREEAASEPAVRAMVHINAWRFFLGAVSRQRRGKVVLTTRLMPLELDTTAGCTRLDLRGLTDEQAVALLRKFDIKGSDAELARGAAEFGGHPLTLARLANWLRYDLTAPRDIRRAPKYAHDLDLKRRRYDIFVRAFRVLPEELRRILLLLAASRGGLAGADLAALAEAANVSANAGAIQELAAEMWISVDADANVRLHPLARRWLTAQDPDPRATHARHAALWEPRARALDLNVLAARDHADVGDLHPVTEYIFHLARAGRYEEAWKALDNDVSAILSARFSAHRLRSELLLESFLDGDERLVPRLGDVQAQGSLLNSLANDFAILGQPARAIPPLERAVSIAHDPRSTAVRLGNLALARIRVGRLRQADAELAQQHDVGEGAGDGINVLVALHERARLAAICGRYDDAVARLSTSRELIQRISQAGDEALETFSPVGWSSERKRRYVELGRVAVGEAYATLALILARKDARAAAEQAVKAAEATGENRSIARAKSLLGAAHAAAGDDAIARRILNRLLPQVQSTGLADLEPEIMLAIARSWLRSRRRTANELALVAEREARWHGNQLQLADAFLVRAMASRAADQVRLAQQARRIAWCDGPPFFYEFVVSAAETLL